MASARKIFSSIGAGFNRLFYGNSSSVSDGRDVHINHDDQINSVPCRNENYEFTVCNNDVNKNESDLPGSMKGQNSQTHHDYPDHVTHAHSEQHTVVPPKFLVQN